MNKNKANRLVNRNKIKINVKKKTFILKENRVKAKQNFALKKEVFLLNLKNKRLAKLNMSPNCFQVLMGSLLGDGSLKINKGYKNARYAVRHSIKAKAYFEWKIAHLLELASDRCVHVQSPAFGSYGKTPMLRFQTLTNPELTEIHSIVTKNNKMCIKRQWLNHLNPLALAVWWFDDGSLQDNWRKGIFCSEGFSKKENYILSTYLRVVWGIKAKVVPRRIFKSNKIMLTPQSLPYQPNNFIMRSSKDLALSWVGYRIKLNATELKKFLRIILPYVPVEEMIYKVCIRYKNLALQQRWISELKKSLPQFEKAIDTFYVRNVAKMGDDSKQIK